MTQHYFVFSSSFSFVSAGYKYELLLTSNFIAAL